MSLLKIYPGQALTAALAEVTIPVRAIYTAVDQPEPDTMQALADLMSLTPCLSLEVQHQPDAPADRLVIQSVDDRELAFLGPPLGLELTALVSAIITAGRGDSGLSPATRRGLARLSGPVRVQVFTTPT